MKGLPTGEKPKAHYPRTSHDFSARRVYHNKVGMITPIKPIDSVPNEHFEIEVSDFLQSMPLATAAFLRGRREFAFYYVPYHQLWSNFGQYMAQRKDRYSSAMKDSKFEPRISLRFLLKWCANVMFYDLARKYPSFIRPNGTAVNSDTLISPIGTLIFQYVGQGTGFARDIFTKASERGQEFNYTFVNHVFVNNDVTETRIPKVSEYVLDKFGQSRWSNMLRKLDLLRYGNYLMFFSKVYDAIESLILSDTEIKESDMSPIETLIFDLFYQINLLPENYYVEPYRILAYNKCYYTFFRNSYYELDYYVGDFNVDHLECSSLATSILLPTDFSVQFLDMYQHQWKKDMFTSLMPDTQFGAVSQFMVTSQDVIGDGSQLGIINSSVNRTSTYQGEGGSQPVGSFLDAELFKNTANEYLIMDDGRNRLYHTHSFSAPVNLNDGQINGLSVISSGDVLALRRAEAIQGYRQTLLRCGNKTKDIMVGLFGVEPVWESDHDPDFIDSFGYDYAVDRVVSTAQTNEELDTYNGKLGDLGGYIAKLGGTRRNIKYTTRGDFGVILPVCYEIIESEYNSYNIDPNILALTPEEHGIPDFMNLGFVPVTRRVLSLLDPRQARFASPYVVPNVDQVLGYGTPYYEKKIDVDICHGILNTFGELQNEGARKFAGNDYVGDFAHWVAPRTDMQSSFVTTTKQFYIDPRILNNNFLLAANGRQETDQFICNTYFKVRRVNWMSDLGLPNF